jgi:hypothetical protein
VRLRAVRMFWEFGPKMREEADLAQRVTALEQQEQASPV